MLTLLILIPIIGSLFLFPLQDDQAVKMKKIALSTSLLNLFF